MNSESNDEIESETRSRFTDVLDEPVDRLLSPIKGYENKPLVSLTEAIAPVSKWFHEVNDYIYVALNNCQNPVDGLDQQESASIHLYTMPFHGGPSLYILLNQSLRAENREDLKPWFSFLKLFFTALYRLPSQSKIVWRGIKNVDLSSAYKPGMKIPWWGVSSCTTHIQVLESNTFLGKHGLRTLFSIECINGKSIVNHSYFKNIEEEVVLMPGSYFEVIGKLNPAADLYIIQLKEILPPIIFVKPPFLKSTIINPSSVINTSNIIVSSATSNVSSIKPPLTSTTKWKQNGLTIAGGNSNGNQLNQLNYPQGIFVDDDHQCIYIADHDNHRIVEWKYDTKKGQAVAGSNGPTDVIVDKKTDSLIICDKNNRRVVRWPRQNGRYGETIISDISCYGLTMDNNEHLYVSDTGKNEVRRWKIGEKTDGIIVAGGNGKGNNLSQLHSPAYLFIDKDYSVYVSDYNNHRVMKWMKDAKEGIVVAGGQGQGDKLTQFSYPQGVVVDDLGNVYVADSFNNRIMCWSKGSKEGRIIVGEEGEGEQANQLSCPIGLSFDREGNLYVVDYRNHRVQKFEIDLN